MKKEKRRLTGMLSPSGKWKSTRLLQLERYFVPDLLCESKNPKTQISSSTKQTG